MIYILAYHSISNSDYHQSVPINVFEEQMKFVRSKFNLLSVNDFPSLDGLDSKKDSIVVTFDDGVEDNYTNAFPILKKYQIPATIFLSTAHVNKIHGGASGYKFQFLNWAQLREMSQNGISVQSHTHSHPLLTQINREKRVAELEKSKRLIEEQLDSPCLYFAYPKCDVNDEVIEDVKLYYVAAFGGPKGVIRNVETLNPFNIPRVIISKNISLAKFKFMLTPTYWFALALRDKFFS